MCTDETFVKAIDPDTGEILEDWTSPGSDNLQATVHDEIAVCERKFDPSYIFIDAKSGNEVYDER